jgi:hypothetical protein
MFPQRIFKGDTEQPTEIEKMLPECRQIIDRCLTRRIGIPAHIISTIYKASSEKPKGKFSESSESKIFECYVLLKTRYDPIALMMKWVWTIFIFAFGITILTHSAYFLLQYAYKGYADSSNAHKNGNSSQEKLTNGMESANSRKDGIMPSSGMMGGLIAADANNNGKAGAECNVEDPSSYKSSTFMGIIIENVLYQFIIGGASPPKLEGLPAQNIASEAGQNKGIENSSPEEICGRSRSFLYFSSVKITILEMRLSFIASFLLPCLYGFLGACTYALRRTSYQVELSAEHSGGQGLGDSILRSKLRLFTGPLSGFTIGWFMPSPTQYSLSPLALAFIGGYGSELLFVVLDDFVSKLSGKSTPISSIKGTNSRPNPANNRNRTKLNKSKTAPNGHEQQHGDGGSIHE